MVVIVLTKQAASAPNGVCLKQPVYSGATALSNSFSFTGKHNTPLPMAAGWPFGQPHKQLLFACKALAVVNTGRPGQAQGILFASVLYCLGLLRRIFNSQCKGGTCRTLLAAYF
ncbi:MAG: hypothetical protein ACK5L3_14885 [Oscillospiraceae bacterium]